jgi:protein-disulfide isomerase
LVLIALVVGIVGGYFGRPLLNKSPITAVATQSSNDSSAQVTLPTATTDPTEVANSQKQLMDYLVSNTSHFMGDPNAKVTIIEFSDYQ